MHPLQNLQVKPSGEPKPIHIFLGIAAHDHRVHTRFMMSIMSLVASGRFKVTLSNVSGGGIHKARNNLAWEFLTKTDAPYYLSADTDISFQTEHVAALVEDIEKYNLGLCGAPYCHKKSKLEWSARALEGILPDPETHLQELNACGTGFLMVKREVFEKIRADHPELAHEEDWAEGRGMIKWDFFSEGVVVDPIYYPKPTFLSEDFYFCKRCRDAGYKVYIDTRFHVMHWEGSRGYPEEEPPKVEQRIEIKEAIRELEEFQASLNKQ